ncbi:tetratricopeptide repeat protein [Dichotomicrobium thermohalophilum]|nr:tetratricopeptide repeat protein [Dichotomicrobium thermohalophilum]
MGAAPAQASVEKALLYAQEGVNALMRGNNGKAIEAYGKALEDENLPEARRASIYNDRGVAHWRERRYEKALADFEKSIELNPDYAPVYNNRGNVLMAMGRVDAAIEDFSRAISLAPAYGAAFNNRGNAYLALGQLEKAEADLRKAVKLLPSSAAPLNGRGKIAAVDARPFASLRYLNRAILLNRNYPAAYRNRAAALIKVRHYDDALNDLEQAAATADGDAQLLILRGQVRRFDGKPQAAVQDFSAALEIAPENGEAYAGRGLAQLERGRVQEALNDCDMAVTFAPDHAPAYLCRARAYLRLGQPVQVSTNISQALDLEPDMAEAYLVRAQLAEEAGDIEAATADYRAALKRDPLLGDARTALRRLGQEDQEGEEKAEAAMPDLTVGEPLNGWSIVKGKSAGYYAVNDDYPDVAVPLEMYGEAQPRLVEWTELTKTLRGFGLLRYHAGSEPGRAGEGDLGHENVAIINLRKERVVAIEPYRVAGEKAQWEWGRYGVTVTDPDGVPSAHQLREEPKVVRREPERRLEDDSWTYEEWRGDRRYDRRRYRRQREPRTLFDWLFR